MSKGDDTRQRIVASTVELLMANGYHATGLNQIVQHSGAPKGSLYFHFPGGKQEIVAEALRTASVWTVEKLSEILDAHNDVGDAVAEALLVFAGMQDECSHDKSCPLAAVAQEVGADLPRVYEILKVSFADWRELFRKRLLRAGFSDAASERWADLILATMEGAQILNRARASSDTLRNSAAVLRAMLSNAVRMQEIG